MSQQLLTPMLLLLWARNILSSPILVQTPLPTAISHVYRPISSAWQNPCLDVTHDATHMRSRGTGPDDLGHGQLLEKMGDLDYQGLTSLKTHKSEMTQHLLMVADTLSQLEEGMVSRLPSREYMDGLHPLTVEGMMVGKLRHLVIDQQWLDISRCAYELLARAYIYIDQMVQDEVGGYEKTLLEPMRQLRLQLLSQLMCPVYTYVMDTEGVHPVSGAIQSQLTTLHQGRSYLTDFTLRSKFHYLIIRDLKKIVDHLRYQIYY